jgi:hypothetical protein
MMFQDGRAVFQDRLESVVQDGFRMAFQDVPSYVNRGQTEVAQAAPHWA